MQADPNVPQPMKKIPRDLTCWFCVRGECDRCAIPRVCACRKCHVVLDCTPPMLHPLIEVEEGDIAIATVKAFNKRQQPTPCGFCDWCAFTTRLLGRAYRSLCTQAPQADVLHDEVV